MVKWGWVIYWTCARIVPGIIFSCVRRDVRSNTRNTSKKQEHPAPPWANFRVGFVGDRGMRVQTPSDACMDWSGRGLAKAYRFVVCDTPLVLKTDVSENHPSGCLLSCVSCGRYTAMKRQTACISAFVVI